MKKSLYIKNLTVAYGNHCVLDNIDYTIIPNKIIAIVGESGSGKTTLAKTIANFLPHHAKVIGGRAEYDKHTFDLTAKVQKRFDLNISMILQDPFAALNPSLKIKKQFKCCCKCKSREAIEKAILLLSEVGISNPKDVLEKYPSELSGGINQRVCIALSLISMPDIIIFDEPTSAIDADNSQMVLSLISQLVRKRHITSIIITHNLPMIKDFADIITVMKDGKIIETSQKTEERQYIFSNDYSILLNQSNYYNAPHIIDFKNKPIAVFENVTKSFGKHTVINNLSFEIFEGETIGILGKSGSGKSTIGKMLMGIYKPNSGHITLDDSVKLEMVFQNAFASLNANHKVKTILNEGAYISKRKRLSNDELYEYIKHFPLPNNILDRYPDQLSGGQRQMIAIIRALIEKPTIIIFDEPTSALDTITQKKLVSLISELKDKYSLTYIFISHDVTLLKGLSNRIIKL